MICVDWAIYRAAAGPFPGLGLRIQRAAVPDIRLRVFLLGIDFRQRAAGTVADERGFHIIFFAEGFGFGFTHFVGGAAIDHQTTLACAAPLNAASADAEAIRVEKRNFHYFIL
jgi:hypothetical protein